MDLATMNRAADWINTRQRSVIAVTVVVLLIVLWNLMTPAPVEHNLPVNLKAYQEGLRLKHFHVRNLISLEDLQQALSDGDEQGLNVDFSHVKKLLNGKDLDPRTIYGRIFTGPYPFEAAETDFPYRRFRKRMHIKDGQGVANIQYLMAPRRNSENWKDAGVIMVRFELFSEQKGKDWNLGVYDIQTAFMKTKKGFVKRPWLVEGPFIQEVNSGRPDRVVIAYETDQTVRGYVELDDGRVIEGPPAKQHLIAIDGLTPSGFYTYRLKIEGQQTPAYTFKTAPAAGETPVRFTFIGDSREDEGGGRRAYMGVNALTIERHMQRALTLGCDFFIMGGDLINGYTSSKTDFQMQFYAWKQSISGFWHSRPVYPAMGNHESLLNVSYFEKRKGIVQIDSWPYETDSAEAAFAAAFRNPENGPQPSDLRRPPYTENVYSFQYGAVRCIAFNNNYWYSDDPTTFGGAPQGYMMDDQLEWIENELEFAEADSSVKYVFLYAQEPVFPNGGHVKDGMWYHGNNGVRAYTWRDGTLQREPQGIVEVRNRLVRAVAACSKSVAVLCSDEHAYHRVLIDAAVPVGDPARDDLNGDEKIDWQGGEPASPLRDLEKRVWYIVCGGGGAPYYAEQPAPWNLYWKRGPNADKMFRYSSQENLVVFDCTEDGVSLRAYNPFGEVMDRVDNLTFPEGR